MTALQPGKLLADASGAPIERLGGFETEYGLSCATGDSPYDDFAGVMVARASKNNNTFGFLDDGARYYIDIGNHPEYSTAEGVSFDGAANLVASGHVKVARAIAAGAEMLSERLGVRRVSLLANNVDIVGNSWGSHENLLARRDLEFSEFIPALVAHNASRIVWSGAGLVKPSPEHGFVFCLSEKADHIWTRASPDTTAYRPLVNLRDEPLADPIDFRRIHGVTGETVFSPTVTGLRLASASIILRACELGVRFEHLEPAKPIWAMRHISNDPSLSARVETANGDSYTGVELQLKIAELAVTSAGAADYLTHQEQTWAQKWLGLLETLRVDKRRCLKQIDWLVKLQLIERALESSGAKGRKAYQVAVGRALSYHSLLPKEGEGMSLLRRGFFEDSPPAEVMDNGVQPPPARASLRADAIKRLSAKGLVPGSPGRTGDYVVGWSHLVIVGVGRVALGNPYEPTNDALENLLNKVGA